MRGRFSVLLLAASPLAFSQNPHRELQHYFTAYRGNSQLILGSSDARQGGGFSLGVGRVDPAFRIGNVPGELIYEGYFHQTSSDGAGQFPAETTLAWGALASVRYRWKFNPSINIFSDIGFGIQWINQTSMDLRLANNTTPSVALGFEFYSSKKNAVLVGVRLLHASNAGRTQPNPGQNFLQYFVTLRY